MSQETLAMSVSERRRLVLLDMVKTGEMLLKEAAWEMRLSYRQAIRVFKRFLKSGAEGLVHRSRGMPSHRRKPEGLKELVLGIYKERYWGFGPTLAAEKLLECEGLSVNRETLRRWLIGAGMWRVGEEGRVHRSKRTRRQHFGDMLQIDGSVHDWLEGRGPRCTLMVLVDDATGRIVLHMAPEETTQAALWVLRKWVKAHGVPVFIYADRRSCYFTNEFVHEPERRKDPAVFTDFMKATRRMNIEMIPAYSPQAKGRVERVNRTLQDRLVKELRLRGISTIEDTNAMLDEFTADYNRRFARPPAEPADAHRTAPRTREEWDYFFCTEETRTVQKDNTVTHKNRQWQILKQPEAPRPGSRVALRRPLTGEPFWVWNNKRLRTRFLGPRPAAANPALFPPAEKPRLACSLDLSHSGSKTKADGEANPPRPLVFEPRSGAQVASQRRPILQAGRESIRTKKATRKTQERGGRTR